MKPIHPMSHLPMLFLAFSAASIAAEPRIHRVRVENMRFEPATLEVKQGDTVIWTNFDIVPHTVTSVGPAKTRGSVESGSISEGASYTLRVERATDLRYFCRFHPMMRATLRAAP